MSSPLRSSFLALGAGVLLLLTGCGGGSDDACDETSCAEGTCAVREERAVCLCGGQPCATTATSAQGRMQREARPLSPMAEPATGTTQGSPSAAYFSFVAQANHKYFFGCGPVSLTPCRVQLFTPDGVLIGEAEYREAFFLQFRPPRAQTYYLAVSASTGDSGSFIYQFKHLGFDDHADFLEGATAVEFAGDQARLAGAHEADGDRDFFRIQVRQGYEYRFTCRGTGQISLAPALWDGQGKALQDALFVYGTEGIAVTYRAPATQALYLSIGKGVGNASTGTYTCDVSSDEDGDSPDTARALVPGTDATGQLDANDVDLFSLALEAGHFYRVSCEAEQGSCALALDEGESQPAGVPLAFKATGTRASLLRVTGEAGSSYVLRAEDLGVDDHGDTAAEATALTAPASLTGSVALGFDQDVFSFPALENHLYRVACDATAGEPGWNVRILDPRGYERVWSRAGVGEASEVMYEAEESTTYTVIVSSPASGRTGRYACRLEPAGVDDYGDNNSDATPVAFPSVLTVNIESWIEADQVLFNAPSQHLLRIRCSSSRGQVCRLEVRSQSYPGVSVTTESGEVQVSDPATTWTVWVAAPPGMTGEYTLSLEDLGPAPAAPVRAAR